MSLQLAAPLGPEDMTVQPMEDASPTKWHLAHTTWFFETFICSSIIPSRRSLTNLQLSLQLGTMKARRLLTSSWRGVRTRPSVERVTAYRADVDDALDRVSRPALIRTRTSRVRWRSGVNHEQQHQELLLTDILALFAASPSQPAHRAPKAAFGRAERCRLRV